MSAMLFGARLLAFNLLPSLTLHPSRHAAFGAPSRPVPAACAAAWHRHWSSAILRRLDLHDRPVLDADRPELPLALLPPDRLARLARQVGAVRCAPRLRRVVVGDQVRELSTVLGADVLAFANSKVGGYLGASVEGAVIARRQDINEAVYGRGKTPRDIVTDPNNRMARADRLVQVLAKY